MKVLLLLLCCFGIFNISTSAQSTLREDLDELIATIPWEELRNLTEIFSQEDDKFIEIIKNIQGKSEDTKFQEFIVRIVINEQFQSFTTWLETDHNINLESEVNNILSDINEITVGSGGNLGGIETFFDEFLKVYSIDDTRLKIIELLRRSNDFIDFFLKISSNESKSFFEEFLFVDEEFKLLIQELSDAGVDVDMIKILFYAILGWDY
nr:uncharacterized protein LOC111426811 [Onthophagus taurus]